MLDEVHNIAVLKISAIGDSALIAPFLNSLKLQMPDISITFICGPSNQSYVNLLSSVDSVIPLTLKNPLLDLIKIRKQRFDLFIDFGTWTYLDSIYANISRSNYKSGFCSANRIRHYGYDSYHTHDLTAHESNNYRNLFLKLGFLLSNTLPVDYRGSTEYNPNGDYIVLHMFSGGSQAAIKEWAQACWAALATKLLANYNIKVFLTGGGDDSYKVEAFKYKFFCDESSVVNCSGIPLQKTLSILYHARCIVTVDTGILHIASTLHLPVVSLHGPTHSSRWGGVSPNTTPIDACEIIEESPIHYGFEPAYYDFMSSIMVDDVYRLLEGIIP